MTIVTEPARCGVVTGHRVTFVIRRLRHRRSTRADFDSRYLIGFDDCHPARQRWIFRTVRAG